MVSKLTLSIKQDVVEKAKKYAKQKGQSLSDLVENYLKVITLEESESAYNSALLTKSLRGSFHATDDFDYNEELTHILTEKYVKNE